MKRVLIVLTTLTVLAVLLHRPLLRAVYNFLISEDRANRVDFVALVNGDRAAMERALQRVNEGTAQSVLVVQRRTPRVVQIGASPSLGDRIKSELVAQGLPASQVQVVATDAVTNWQLARQLDQCIRSSDPKARIAILYPEHQTRHMRWIVDHVVPPSRVDRYDVCSFSPGNFDADSWWSNRTALVKVAVAYLRLSHAVGFGEGDFEADNWSPEAYEQSLRNLAEAA